MEEIKVQVKENWKPFCSIGLGLLGTGYVLIRSKQWYTKRLLRKKWDSLPKDTVYLHQFHRSATCPSPSPYVLKLESYLRATQIPYTTGFDQAQGPKGKAPWMTINGHDLSDSQLCINFLNDKFDKDLDSHLSAEQKATSHCVRIMIEEHYMWAFAMDRYVFSNQDFTKWLVLPGIPKCLINSLVKMFSSMVKKGAYVQGIGRHNRKDIEAFGLTDLGFVSTILGNKKYLFSDERLSEVDLIIFATVAEILTCSPDSSIYAIAIKNDFPNLERHFLMMKNQLWPDWENPKNEMMEKE
ncbi:failed axon connections homolog [Tigriopus californicus]|uniref:failed axon connections homolog n=1 Tax=Tigriopus californicus TaxID=6832 RepID=UPI0027D9D9FF|nr:failed axon connections homolog [Tigriopus californicus]